MNKCQKCTFTLENKSVCQRGRIQNFSDDCHCPDFQLSLNICTECGKRISPDERIWIIPGSNGEGRSHFTCHEKKEIRQFDSGATRDTAEGKLSYVKALSPIVLRRYVQYLDKHRKQSDGSMREFDNWKKGIPEDTYLDSLGRHFVDTWLMIHGFFAEDNHGPCNLQDVLCAIMFNSMGLLHEILTDELGRGER